MTDMIENQTQLTPDEQHQVETFGLIDAVREKLDAQPVPDEGRMMTEEHAKAVLETLAEDKRLPQIDPETGAVRATTAEAQEIAKRVWWKTAFYSKAGLNMMFPGLNNYEPKRKKK